MTQSNVESPSPARRSGGAGRVLVVILGVVLLLVGLAALAWTVGRSTDTRTETFPGEVDRLVIEVNGRVTVEAGDATEVTVEREWLFVGAPTVDLSQEGGTVRVESDCGLVDFGCQAHVTATAPAGAQVVVQTAAGNVNVSGFQSGVDLTTSAGNVIVSDITGPATLRSSAGRIEGDITDGDVDAVTSAGRIELRVMGEFSTLSAVTSAGNVSLVVPDGSYAVDADTSAGQVEIDVPTDPDATSQIVARSSAGSISIDRLGG